MKPVPLVGGAGGGFEHSNSAANGGIAASMTASPIPRLARGVKLRLDATRERWVVLAPERLLVPDDTALAVLRLVDGRRDLAAISGELATTFDAPVHRIAADVACMLGEMAAQGVVVLA